MSTTAHQAGGPTTQYIPAAQVYKRYAVSRATLRRWAQDGRIRAVRTAGGGKRLYAVTDLDQLYQSTAIADANPKAKVIYARVSSSKQRGDLDRQIQDLQRECPGYALIQDIGSGLNWHRKGFQALLERVHQRDVEEVVVAHRDRLCRFGLELVEWIFQKAGVKLVVLSDRDHNIHSNSDPDGTLAQELSEDLLSIVTVFVAKNNGRRAAENRKRRAAETQTGGEKTRRKKGQAEEVRGDESASSQSQEDSSLSQ
jgi:excisionase family DNA binding protein